MYDQHKELLNGQTHRDVAAFIHSEAELPAFTKVSTSKSMRMCLINTILIAHYAQRVRSLRACSAELAELRRSVRLNLLHINCGAVNDLLSNTALELVEMITTHLINVNRQKNKE